MNNPRQTYPTDLSDAEWAVIEKLVPAVKSGGRPALYVRREIVNAILYVERSGCAWRLLPHDFPPWETVYGYFNRWCKAGVWERMRRAVYDELRTELKRNSQASAGIIDSQSVKTSEKGASKAMTIPSGSKDASVISWSIRKD